ncbi:MAG: polysaccharide biosynthesis protein [Rickettsiales bacterium]|nr:polysaccharide biosynthesis protein [Rickettsiales bacterium]
MNGLLSVLRSLSRRYKLLILSSIDFSTAFACWVIFGPPFTALIASNFQVGLLSIISLNIYNFIIPTAVTFIYFVKSGFYRSSIRYSESRDLITRALKGSAVFGISWGIVYTAEYEVVRNQYLVATIFKSLFLAFVFYAFLQTSRDAARIILNFTKRENIGKPVLIYGAGVAGNELYQSIKHNHEINIVGFFDDSKALSGAEINSIKIYGKKKHLKELTEIYPNLEVYLAIPSLSVSERRRIISSLEKYKVAVRTIPTLHEIVANQKKMVEMQDLSIDDILPRNTVRYSPISFYGMNLMITGAGGSIGSEIVRQALLGNPNKIVLFELSEINLYSIQEEIESIIKAKDISVEVISVLGDVKDKFRLKEIINNHSIDFIYHAAAYKHVPIVEYYENISEGLKNNIFGTKALCEVASECNVKKVVVISTDKAVRPTNIMGASKRLAEMVVQSIDSENSNTKYCIVRFGNVINSSGSVIPLFRKQIAQGGPVTITHKEVTRYFMTISEASSLVIQAGEFAEGGDVFILDMGDQVKIFELAEKLIYLSGRNISHDGQGEGIEIKEIGLRPGEKLYEELLISGDKLKTSNSKIFKSIEKYPAKDVLTKVLDDLYNASLSNDVLEIRNILKTNVEGFKEAKNE